MATGSSPLSFYEQIVESDLDLSGLTSVNLDEYIGLSGENPQSYRYFMQEHLFNQSLLKKAFYQMVLLKMRSRSETLQPNFGRTPC